MAIDYTTPLGQVRLLISDDRESDQVFNDPMIEGFLALEGDSVKRAAAAALLAIAGDEALTSKVIRTQDLQTDGAKLAAELRAQAKDLRAQAADEDDGYFELVDGVGPCVPELTEDPYRWPVWP